MSPTSYQAAPPRTTTIDHARNAVKSWRENGSAVRPHGRGRQFVYNFNLSSGTFLLIGLIDFPAPFCYFHGAGEVHSGSLAMTRGAITITHNAIATAVAIPVVQAIVRIRPVIVRGVPIG